MKTNISILGLFLLLFVSSNAQSVFIPNQGQWTEDFDYKWENGNSTVFLQNNELVFHLQNRADFHHLLHSDEIFTINHHAFKVAFKNGADPIFVPQQKASTYHNYFLGKDPKRWKGKVPLYQGLILEEVYPGIDVHYSTEEQSLKYNIHVQSGSDPSQIEMEYSGADSLFLESGYLIILTSVGEVIEQKPLVWQIIKGEKKIVDCKFILNEQSLSFQLGKYNKRHPLVIDPQYIFSTFSNSTADNWGFTACSDSSGNMYGGGVAFSNGYPVTLGAFQDTFSGGNVDLAISKFSPDGTQLLFATYVGGNMPEQPHSMVVGGPNEGLFVMGVTGSDNFPVTTTAFDTTFNGGDTTNSNVGNFLLGMDIFVFHLDNSGSILNGSTYIGGAKNDGFMNDLLKNYGDEARGEIYHDSTQICIASATHSTDFPGQTPATTPPGLNAVIFTLSDDCSALNISRLIGGNKADAAFSLVGFKENGQSKLAIAGGTRSTDLPCSANAYQSNFAGDTADGFIAIYDYTSQQISHLTYNGTNKYDQNYFVAVDRDFAIYVYGQTNGYMPVIPSNNWSVDSSAQFIQKYNTTLTTMLKGTVFGDGSISEIDISPTAFMVDKCKNIYLSGWGGISNEEGNTFGLPTTPDARDTITDGNDFYFLVMDGSWQHLEYATFFGEASSEHVDGGTSRFSKDGTMYQAICAGCSGQTFPTFPSNVYSHINPGPNCNLGCTKIHFDFKEAIVDINIVPDSTCAPHTLTWTDNSKNIDLLIWDFGDGTVDTGFSPTKLYTDTGHYIIKIIGIDTMCTTSDTTFKDLYLFNSSVKAGFQTTTYDTCTTPYIVGFNNKSQYATQYQWDFGDGQGSNVTNPVHTYQNAGTYLVTLIAIDNLCNTADTTSQQVYFKTAGEDADFDLTFNPCDSNLLVLGQQTGSFYNKFTWDMGDGTNLTGPNIIHKYSQPGMYTVSLISEDTICNVQEVTSQTIYVSSTIDPNELLPNIFTPNGDGVNDYFKLVQEGLGFRFTQFSIEVYNRWGLPVFASDDPNFKWNGHYKGNKLANGVYFWIVHTFDSCEDKLDFKGIVHIN